MVGKQASWPIVPIEGLRPSNTGWSFFVYFTGGFNMLPDTPLFWFEYDLIYSLQRFWLVEYCVLWNGERIVMEMVEIKGDESGYFSEN
jgi:hypothetical protein